MINNFEEFDDFITDDMIEKYLDARFNRLFSNSWDEYQVHKAREWLKKVRDGQSEPPEGD